MNVDNSAVAGEQAGAPPSQPKPSPHQRILVVEDDVDIRRLNTEALLRSGYEVDAAEHGAAAWETLQIKKYNLMVTDNEMPVLTGVDLLKKMHAARMDLRVIMATGSVPADEFTRQPWLLPAALLIKPYTIDELIGSVREALRVDDGPRAEAGQPGAPQGRPSADDWHRLLVSLKQDGP